MPKINYSILLVRKKLKELHEEENNLNVAIGKYDAEIRKIKSQKRKLARRISNNMKYRNKLINKL